MIINSPRQLKDWINNFSKKNNIQANTLLQNYMMERFLERISASKYRENFILKGGFLISALVGLDMRSTMDMDTTVKGLTVTQDSLEDILNEIILIDLNDNVMFHLASFKPIHDAGDYDDFRVSIIAQFFTIKVTLKLDITTGDVIIPSDMDYSFKMMFEERSISIRAYNLYTILAEKIESILARNVTNTRARDFYDVYILTALRKDEIEISTLLDAIQRKAVERDTSMYFENHEKYLKDIEESDYLQEIWVAYSSKYPYANGISFKDIMSVLRGLFLAS